MRGLADISTHIMAAEMYSIEFTTEGVHRYMSVRFWWDDSLVRISLHRHNQTDPYPDCYLAAISSLLSFVSTKPDLVSISGCSSMIFKTLETCGLFNHGIQYPFRFEIFSLPELMHPDALQTSYIFGRIDIFSQLKFLVVFLRGGVSQTWALKSPELCKVIYFLSILLFPAHSYFDLLLTNPSSYFHNDAEAPFYLIVFIGHSSV